MADPSDQRTAVVLAGQNGAGKSTLYHRHLVPLAQRFGVDMGPWLNADEYARQQWGPGHDLVHAYEAAQEIARRRTELIEAGLSFTTETVFSHPSKLELVEQLADAGYHVYLEIVVVPVETSVRRVAQRALAGGHDVPEDKIRDRAIRADGLIAKALPLVHQARIWQNVDERPNEEDKLGHQRIARLQDGVLAVRTKLPGWMGRNLRRAIVTAPGPSQER